MKVLIRKLKAECKALDAKRVKLATFLTEDAEVGGEDRELLILQAKIMERYSRILTKRITLLEGRDGKKESK